VKLLWFPIVKCWLKQEYLGEKLNREQKRRRKKLKLSRQGKIIVVIDRTQWKQRNLMVVSLVWGKHALPVYWEQMAQKGSSNLSFQKKVLQPVLKLIKPYPLIVVGDLRCALHFEETSKLRTENFTAPPRSLAQRKGSRLYSSPKKELLYSNRRLGISSLETDGISTGRCSISSEYFL
jgi:hypothetical protein